MTSKYPFAQPQRPKLPLVPEDRDRHSRPSDKVVRAVCAMLRARAARPTAARLDSSDVEAELTKAYPDDRAALLLTRAAVSGATTTTAGWAAELANTALVDLIATPTPLAASPGLFAAAPALTIDGNAIFAVPNFPTLTGAFVGEGAPIPVKSGVISSTPLRVAKIGAIVACSIELTKFSDFELRVRRSLSEGVPALIDMILFDTNPASSVRPAGLLNGVGASTATAGGGATAMFADVTKLANAVAAASGGSIAFIVSPDLSPALTLGFAAGGGFPYAWFVSAALPAATMVCIALPAFLSAADPAISFDVSTSGIVHLEDSSPGQITIGAAAVSHPSVSFWQSGRIGIEMHFSVTWAVRSGGISWVTSVTWG